MTESEVTPWIQNVSLSELICGKHDDPGLHSMLIQIVDPAMSFSKPKFKFSEIHKFKFMDLDDIDPGDDKHKITDQQATDIANLLQYALDNKMNVIVSCHAGLFRSGAITEVGVMLGFADTDKFRSANLLVKHKLMDILF